MKKITIIVGTVLIVTMAAIGIAFKLDVNAAETPASVSSINYKMQKSFHDYVGDGWVYVFEIYYPQNNSQDILYLFDGYNLKYKELEDCYVPIIDKKTNTIIDKIIPDYVTLSISEKYKDDVKTITDYFNKKQYEKTISLEDLKELNTKQIEKSYIVEIFNNTINSKVKKNVGEYYNTSFLERITVESSDENLKGEWQLSYMIDFGYISEVNIEFITHENDYILSNHDTKSILIYTNLQDEINNIEKQIIEEQSFDIDISTNAIYNANSKNNIISNNDLKELIQKANDKLKK